MNRILLVDDDRNNLSFYKKVLEQEGYEVDQAFDAQSAALIVEKNPCTFGLAIVDFHMPNVMGDEAIRWLKRVDPDLQVLCMTGDESTEVIERNIVSGASAVFYRDRGVEALLRIVASYCARFQRHIRAVSNIQENNKSSFLAKFGMVGESDSLIKTCQSIEKYAAGADSVLILGENGTGKERVARAVHQLSQVAEGPFVPVNCAALSEGVLESELFGHVKGAFTGAQADRLGLFRQAHGGTLFLDEVGELPINLQAKLLRAIQEREVVPVGSSKAVKVNVRIIAATNVDLVSAIRSGKFREDLFYRLNVLPIQLAPLRERTEDIESMVCLFVGKWNRRSSSTKSVRADAIELLKKYSWPGNVRELENTVYRALSRSTGECVEIGDFDDFFQKLQGSSPLPARELNYEALKAKHLLEEREFLRQILEKAGSISKAATRLNMAKTTFYERMRHLGIKSSRTV